MKIVCTIMKNPFIGLLLFCPMTMLYNEDQYFKAQTT